MFVCGDPDHSRADEDAAPGIDAWLESARGTCIQSVRLQPVADATTVRVRDAELLLTDGPFTESREWVAGFALLDCADLDEAIELAARHPMAWMGRIELRPVHSMDGPDA